MSPPSCHSGGAKFNDRKGLGQETATPFRARRSLFRGPSPAKTRPGGTIPQAQLPG